MKVKRYVPAVLATIRKSAGLTQQQLATYAGISQPSLCEYENYREPRREVLERLLAECNAAAKQLDRRHKAWTINNVLED